MPTYQRPDKGVWLTVSLVILVLAFAVLSGAVVGLGSKLLLFPVFFIVGAVAFAVMPVRLSIWGLALVCLLVEGPVIYFLKFEFFRWFPPIFSIALALPLLLLVMHRRAGGVTLRGTPPFVAWLILFVGTVTFSTAISEPSLGELLTAWRDYIAFWPVMLLLFMGVLSEEQLRNVWRFLLIVAILQLPVTLYQHFFVASRSAWSSNWDAVVGTFPGNAEGGGASAAMAIFVLIAVLAAVALWQRGRMRTWLAVAISLAGATTMLFAEVKAAALLIPVGIAVLYAREIARRPMQALLMLVAGTLTVFVIFTTYNQMYYGYDPTKAAAQHRPESPFEAIGNQLDPERTSSQGHELSRAGLLDEWWGHNVRAGDFHHALLGYGAGATNISRLGIGEAIARFRHYIDNISSSFLLWETGLLGHALFVLLLASTARQGFRLSRVGGVPVEHQALLHAAAVGVLILLLTLPYKNFVFKTPPSQFLMVFMLGYIGYWYRRVQVLDAAKESEIPAAGPQKGTRPAR
jgi:hypothetical protein